MEEAAELDAQIAELEADVQGLEPDAETEQAPVPLELLADDPAFPALSDERPHQALTDEAELEDRWSDSPGVTQTDVALNGEVDREPEPQTQNMEAPAIEAEPFDHVHYETIRAALEEQKRGWFSGHWQRVNSWWQNMRDHFVEWREQLQERAETYRTRGLPTDGNLGQDLQGGHSYEPPSPAIDP